MNDVVAAHVDPALDGGMMEDPATVTQLGLRANHGEGFHHHVLTQLGAFLDYGLGMDGNSHLRNFLPQPRSRTSNWPRKRLDRLRCIPHWPWPTCSP